MGKHIEAAAARLGKLHLYLMGRTFPFPIMINHYSIKKSRCQARFFKAATTISIINGMSPRVSGSAALSPVLKSDNA